MKKKISLLFLILIIFSCNKFKEKLPIINNDPEVNNDNNQKITDLQNQLHLIAANDTSSVVFIYTEKTITEKYYDPFDYFFENPWDLNSKKNSKERKFKQTALGSGIIFKKKTNNYYIITNSHVINGADNIKITINDNKSYKGQIIGSDQNIDIAIIKIKSNENLRVAKTGDSETVKVGDFVAAIGNPFGLSMTMTFGIISAIGRSDIYSERITLTDFIQTDAAINPGNSGGPLINIFGEVIGINTLIYSENGENTGIGFALPINIVKTISDQIIDKGKVEHGFLGIYFKELNEEDIKILGLNNIENGILVTEIIKNTPAEKYDIKVGDIIVEINDNKIETGRDLSLMIGKSSPGSKINLKIFRNNKLIIKKIILGIRK